MADDIYISISLEPDEDAPVADIVYRGVQWASMTLAAGELVVTLYGDENSPPTVPIDDAIGSLERARMRLLQLGGEEPKPESSGT
jgi:hypothetical protein